MEALEMLSLKIHLINLDKTDTKIDETVQTRPCSLKINSHKPWKWLEIME
jgi:hypothetical protein